MNLPKRLESILTEWSDVFEWLWDFSEWELSEVSHDWLLGELHELLFGLESVIQIFVRECLKISNIASIKHGHFRSFICKLLTLSPWQWWF